MKHHKISFKKSAWSVLVLAGLCTALPGFAETIHLPSPDKTGGMPLMDAISARQSARVFSETEVPDAVLSTLLYSAFGVSHDGKHTIPTAMNQENLQVYVLRKDGAFLYDSQKNTLERITKRDLRPLLATQTYVLNAPITLVYAGSDSNNTPLHAGSAYQNVGLYAASAGLNTVVRTGFDKKSLAQALSLNDGVFVAASQTIGWPVKTK